MSDAGVQNPASFPDYRGSVSLKYVKRGFELLCRHGVTILLVPLAGMGLLELANMYRQGELMELFIVARQTNLTFDMMTVVASITVFVVAVLSYILLQVRPVYLVDFSCYRPPEEWKTSRELFMKRSRASGKFTEESLVFQDKILARSGLGEETYLPPAVLVVPPDITMANARAEFEAVIFTAVKDLLSKTGTSPKEIGILIVNCSLFNPTPSLSAMIMNHFKMRSNVINYNLSGMGCSAGVVAVDLARQLLQLYPNKKAIVVSTENITQNWYFGNDRAMLLPNCLFRVAGSAMLLSNRRRDLWRSKYELLHLVRTNLAANDLAYNCIFQCQDSDNIMGVRLSKDLMAMAGEALKVNITTLGPLVLPVSEQLLFFFNLVMRKVLGRKMKSYIPDFTTAFEHVCIHTGGRAVIDEIEKQLKLTPHMVEPSRATLYRYGNISSASIWYVLAFIESQRGIRRGDRIWQLGFGSGFKCNSAVWRALRKIKEKKHTVWDGFDLVEMRNHLASLPNHKHAQKH